MSSLYMHRDVIIGSCKMPRNPYRATHRLQYSEAKSCILSIVLPIASEMCTIVYSRNHLLIAFEWCLKWANIPLQFCNFIVTYITIRFTTESTYYYPFVHSFATIKTQGIQPTANKNLTNLTGVIVIEDKLKVIK